MKVPAPVEAPFGVAIASAGAHLHLACAACASVRYFMGDTPICLLFDGKQSTAGLEETYGVRVIRPADVEHADLRELSFGSWFTKLASLWLAPFETFLFIDADAIVWGDVRQAVDFGATDFVIDVPMRNPGEIRRFGMDVEAIREHFPDFDPRGRIANVGVFYARRGLLDLDEYLDLVRFHRRYPKVIPTEQGVFQLMVLSRADAGLVRLEQRQIQVGPQYTTPEEVRRRFALRDGRPVVDGEPTVLHHLGWQKPRLREGENDHFEPFTFFRREYLRARYGRLPRGAELRLRLEDLPLELTLTTGQLLTRLLYQPRRVKLAVGIRRQALRRRLRLR